MKQKRLYVALSVILIMAGKVSPASAHGGMDELSGTGDILVGILSAMVALIVIFVIWAPGQTMLRPVQYGIVGLGVTTASIHLLEGSNAAPWLILNGLGYVGLFVILYLPFGFLDGVRNRVLWGLISYTSLTIVLFFVTHPWGMYQGSIEWLGLWTKAVELALIGLLIVDLKHKQKRSNFFTTVCR